MAVVCGSILSLEKEFMQLHNPNFWIGTLPELRKSWSSKLGLARWVEAKRALLVRLILVSKFLLLLLVKCFQS